MTVNRLNIDSIRSSGETIRIGTISSQQRRMRESDEKEVN